MRRSPVIFVVCSVRPRSGKTTLARVLVDYLLLDGRDPFVIDAGDSVHALRPYFPGRTAAVDYGQTLGRMRIFDTIMAGPGRDYVIDLAAGSTPHFFRFASELNFMNEARAAGFRTVVICFGAGVAGPLSGLDRESGADLFIAAASGRRARAEEAMQFPELDEETAEAIAPRRISLRAFLLGDESPIPEPCRGPLKAYLFQVMSALREIELELSRKKLRA
jgi:hypothetical protein